MGIELEFANSAVRHGATKEDIYHAFDTRRVDAVTYDKDLNGCNLLIGFDCNANLLEVLYDEINDETIRVYHAMKCRPALVRKYLH
jgi:hypothetical protein